MNTNIYFSFILLMPLSSLISGVGYMSTTLKSPSDVSDTLILFILDALTQWSFNLYEQPELIQNPKVYFGKKYISPCAAVHVCYVMEACDWVQSIYLLPHMVGTSFVLVVLKKLNVSEPKQWVTLSHRTGVNFPFLRGKRVQYFSVSA